MPAIELTLLTGNEVALWGQSVAEVYVAVQVRNTGAAELRGLAPGKFRFVAGDGTVHDTTGAMNDSDCSRSAINAGGAAICNLFFRLDPPVPRNSVLPASVTLTTGGVNGETQLAAWD